MTRPEPGGGSRTADEQIRRARAWLTRVVEPGNCAVHDLVLALGPVDAAATIRSGLAPGAVLAAAGARRGEDQVDRDLATAARHGIRLVTPEDGEWPAGMLLAMELAVSHGVPDLAPPLALWARGAGRIDECLPRAVAIVGARASTAYGDHVASELAFGLADRGWTIVSGGALGIDGAAHRGALAADGATIAVLACGLDRPYPASHGALFERITDSGVLVSEWPPGCAPYRQRFLVRNRLIAGLSAGTVVVEAAARSGTAATARRAHELGRPVMAVPGPVTSALSVGTHELLRRLEERPARLVCNAAQVLEEVGQLGVDLVEPARGEQTARDGLDAMSRLVLDSVPVRRGVEPERIARSAGVDVLDVLRVLPALEVHDLVEFTAGGWRLGPGSRQPAGTKADGLPNTAG